MTRGYKPEQALTINPATAFAEQKVRICVPCSEAGIRVVATRLVAIEPGDRTPAHRGRRKTVPMCTRHASAAWKPGTASVAEITLEGELARYPEEKP